MQWILIAAATNGLAKMWLRSEKRNRNGIPFALSKIRKARRNVHKTSWTPKNRAVALYKGAIKGPKDIFKKAKQPVQEIENVSEECKENYQAQVVPEIYGESTDKEKETVKVIEELSPVQVNTVADEVAATCYNYFVANLESSYEKQNLAEPISNSDLPREIEYTSIDLNPNISISCEESLPESDMQFQITDKKPCDYASPRDKYLSGLFSNKLCESMYYDYSRVEYLDLSELSSVNSPEFNNILDEEMSKSVGMNGVYDYTPFYSQPANVTENMISSAPCEEER